MANNRMYLVHKPTGFSFYLGKRMGYMWYCSYPDLNEFFEHVSKNDDSGDQDDFIIAHEDIGDSIVSVEVTGWDASTPENKFTRVHFNFNEVSGGERSANARAEVYASIARQQELEIDALKNTIAMLSRNQKDPKPIIDVPL